MKKIGKVYNNWNRNDRQKTSDQERQDTLVNIVMYHIVKSCLAYYICR